MNRLSDNNYQNDTVSICIICSKPIEPEQIAKDSSLSNNRCISCNRKLRTIIDKVIPKAIPVDINENEVKLFLSCSNCDKLVALFERDNPRLYISCIAVKITLCNKCHLAVFQTFLNVHSDNSYLSLRKLVN